MSSSLSSTGPARRGRPPSEHKRAAVLEAATGVFLRDGFDGTSVDVIAAEAGVAKQTVYSHFGGKDALFLEVLHAARTGGGPGGASSPPGWADAPDLRAALTEFGVAHLGLVLSPRVAALRRLTIGELGRRPELRELWNRDGPAQLIELLREEYAALDRAGRLRVPDPGRAVEQHLALLAYPANMRSLYGVHELDEQARREIAGPAADMMLAAYRPELP